MAQAQPVDQFLAAIRERDGDAARRVLSSHPDVETASVHAAAAAGRDDVVAREIARDPNLVHAEHTADRGTALAYACGSPLHTDPARGAGILAVVDRLLAAGADPTRASIFAGGGENARLSALFYACSSNNLPLVRRLLERGVSTQDGESIYHSAQDGHLDALQLLADFGADFSEAQAPYGNTPLYFLAGHHFDDEGRAPWLAGFRWLLDRGADPNVPSGKTREVPLHAVARAPGLVRALTLLLDHGADPNLPRSDGRTPYALAVRRGSTPALEAFRRHGVDESRVTDVDRFLGACVRADEHDARRLLAAHPGLMETLTPDDQQTFRFAIQDGSVAALDLMRALGFDVMRDTDEGGTPLHEAAWLGRREVVRRYLDWGASVNVRDRQFGSSPVGWTAHGSQFARGRDDDYVAILDMLAAAGAQFAASINKWGEEPASMASPAVAARLRAHKLTRDTQAGLDG